MVNRVIKKTIQYIKQKKDPVKYARSLGVIVGDRCIIESFNFGSEPYLIELGNHVEIATNVTFITHDGATWVLREDPKYQDVIRFGKIIIHDNVFIGHGSIILPNVEIGENVIIGAGSVVTKNVPSNSVYAGTPAKFITKFENYAKKCLIETPDWDRNRYKKNKKAEILRILNKE